MHFARILAGRTHGIASRTQRHANVDCGAFFGLRIDRKRPILLVLPAAPFSIRPSPRPVLAALEVKTCAGVANLKMNLIGITPQLHLELLHPAVLHPVVQRFL